VQVVVHAVHAVVVQPVADLGQPRVDARLVVLAVAGLADVARAGVSAEVDHPLEGAPAVLVPVRVPGQPRRAERPSIRGALHHLRATRTGISTTAATARVETLVDAAGAVVVPAVADLRSSGVDLGTA